MGFQLWLKVGGLLVPLEQNSPYNLNYPGKITPTKAKKAFLSIIDLIETNNISPKNCLIYIFHN